MTVPYILMIRVGIEQTPSAPMQSVDDSSIFVLNSIYLQAIVLHGHDRTRQSFRGAMYWYC